MRQNYTCQLVVHIQVIHCIRLQTYFASVQQQQFIWIDRLQPLHVSLYNNEGKGA